MTAVSFPESPRGAVQAPPSKSAFQRLVIAAALSDGDTEILRGPGTLCQDMEAVLRAVRSLGAEAVPGKNEDNVFRIHPVSLPEFNSNSNINRRACVIDCGESGAVLRFLMPVSAALGITAEFRGHGSLPERPIADLCRALKQHGITFTAEKLPFTLSGTLSGGMFELPGNVSSQYITGLLFALPLLNRNCGIRLTSPLQSADYVRMTLDILNRFDVHPVPAENGWDIPADSRYHTPGTVRAEGDWSGAAALLVLGAVRGSIAVSGLDPDSIQGDRKILSILKQSGADVHAGPDIVTVRSAPLHGAETDMTHIPDLLPVLAVLGAAARGETRLTNCGRARVKECDRLAASCELIQTLGGHAEIQGDTLLIRGGYPLRGGTVNTYGDHRMVMAGAVAAALTRDSAAVCLMGEDAVKKSWPDFFQILQKTGGFLS